MEVERQAQVDKEKLKCRRLKGRLKNILGRKIGLKAQIKCQQPEIIPFLGLVHKKEK